MGIDDDLAISDSEDEAESNTDQMVTKQEATLEIENDNDDDGGGLWF